MAVILTLFISTTKLHIISETTKFLGYSLQDLREAPEHQRSARKRPKVELRNEIWICSILIEHVMLCAIQNENYQINRLKNLKNTE